MAALGLNSTWGRTDWAPILIEALGLESAVLRGAVAATPVTGKSAVFARVKIDPAADWIGELAPLPSDAGNADSLTLTPRKVGNIVVISTEAVEDSPVAELDQVGNSLVRGLSKKIDTTFFGNGASSTTVPAGIRHASFSVPTASGSTTTPGGLLDAVGAIASAGGLANVIWLAPADLTALRKGVATATGSLLADPTGVGVETIGGARLVPTAALSAGTAVVADARYVRFAVRRDASAEFSEHHSFGVDGVSARAAARTMAAPRAGSRRQRSCRPSNPAARVAPGPSLRGASGRLSAADGSPA